MTRAQPHQLPAGLSGYRLRNLAVRPAWLDHAACRDQPTSLFFVEARGAEGRKGAGRARQVCAGCPVRFECLAVAIGEAEEFGIFGGCTERQRREIRHLVELVEAEGELSAA